MLLADTRAEVEAHLGSLTPDRRRTIGNAARERILREHTFSHRAKQVEQTVGQWANVS